MRLHSAVNKKEFILRRVADFFLDYFSLLLSERVFAGNKVPYSLRFAFYIVLFRMDILRIFLFKKRGKNDFFHYLRFDQKLMCHIITIKQPHKEYYPIGRRQKGRRNMMHTE